MVRESRDTGSGLDADDLMRGLPHRISDVILPWVARTPDRPALVDAGGFWTYAELGEAVAAARRWLARRGVGAGDRVILVADNCRAAAALLLAAADLDAWTVPVTPRLSAPEIAAIRASSGARLVLHALASRPALELHAVRHDAPVEEIPGIGALGVGAFDAAARAEPVEDDPARRVAAVIYTSGSTGQPKGVMLTHRNVLFVAASSGLIRSVCPEDRLACVLPVSHSVGLSSLLLGALLHGASLRLFHRFNPPELLSALDREPLSIMLGAPGLFALLLDYTGRKGIARVRGRALRIISCSGAPLDPAVKVGTERLFGMPLGHGYGVTEAGPTIAQTLPGQQRDDLSVGPPLPGVELRLVSAEGGPVAEGEIGELRVRGPNIMRGYYGAPEETAAAVDAEGWLNTGDLARIVGGELFLLGRTKDLIIRFGFNVYPSEVEAVLNAHPGVVQSAVLGRPVGGGEEEVVAFVQPTPGAAPTEQELARHAASRLASYKLPSEIVFVTDMPTAPNGKILKRQLLAQASTGSAP